SSIPPPVAPLPKLQPPPRTTPPPPPVAAMPPPVPSPVAPPVASPLAPPVAPASASPAAPPVLPAAPLPQPTIPDPVPATVRAPPLSMESEARREEGPSPMGITGSSRVDELIANFSAGGGAGLGRSDQRVARDLRKMAGVETSPVPPWVDPASSAPSGRRE